MWQFWAAPSFSGSHRHIAKYRVNGGTSGKRSHGHWSNLWLWEWHQFSSFFSSFWIFFWFLLLDTFKSSGQHSSENKKGLWSMSVDNNKLIRFFPGSLALCKYSQVIQKSWCIFESIWWYSCKLVFKRKFEARSSSRDRERHRTPNPCHQNSLCQRKRGRWNRWRWKNKQKKKTARNVSLPFLKHWKKLSKASLYFISFNRFYFAPVHTYAVYQVLEMHISKGELSADS